MFKDKLMQNKIGCLTLLGITLGTQPASSEAPNQAVDSGWEVSVSLGYAISSVVQPKYATDDPARLLPNDYQDDVSSKIIAMGNFVYHRHRTHETTRTQALTGNWGPSIGIASTEDGGFDSYYIGVSRHFRHQLYITVGLNVQDVKLANPSGSSMDHITRSETGWFLAISGPIIGNKDRIFGFLDLEPSDEVLN